ncbi:hypothetical protein N0V90_005544 [Kalmusia sp. IMI 367209]|nr:hypothetical protein N0V90_005544 [Kalmusia sp. IMI 367209]
MSGLSNTHSTDMPSAESNAVPNLVLQRDNSPHFEAFILHPTCENTANCIKWSHKLEQLLLDPVGIEKHVGQLGPNHSVIDDIRELHVEQYYFIKSCVEERKGKLVSAQAGKAVDMVTKLGTFAVKPIIFILSTSKAEEEVGSIEAKETQSISAKPTASTAPGGFGNGVKPPTKGPLKTFHSPFGEFDVVNCSKSTTRLPSTAFSSQSTSTNYTIAEINKRSDVQQYRQRQEAGGKICDRFLQEPYALICHWQVVPLCIDTAISFEELRIADMKAGYTGPRKVGNKRKCSIDLTASKLTKSRLDESASAVQPTTVNLPRVSGQEKLSQVSDPKPVAAGVSLSESSSPLNTSRSKNAAPSVVNLSSTGPATSGTNRTITESNNARKLFVYSPSSGMPSLKSSSSSSPPTTGSKPSMPDVRNDVSEPADGTLANHSTALGPPKGLTKIIGPSVSPNTSWILFKREILDNPPDSKKGTSFGASATQSKTDSQPHKDYKLRLFGEPVPQNTAYWLLKNKNEMSSTTRPIVARNTEATLTKEPAATPRIFSPILGNLFGSSQSRLIFGPVSASSTNPSSNTNTTESPINKNEALNVYAAANDHPKSCSERQNLESSTSSTPPAPVTILGNTLVQEATKQTDQEAQPTRKPNGMQAASSKVSSSTSARDLTPSATAHPQASLNSTPGSKSHISPHIPSKCSPPLSEASSEERNNDLQDIVAELALHREPWMCTICSTNLFSHGEGERIMQLCDSCANLKGTACDICKAAIEKRERGDNAQDLRLLRLISNPAERSRRGRGGFMKDYGKATVANMAKQHISTTTGSNDGQATSTTNQATSNQFTMPAPGMGVAGTAVKRGQKRKDESYLLDL